MSSSEKTPTAIVTIETIGSALKFAHDAIKLLQNQMDLQFEQLQFRANELKLKEQQLELERLSIEDSIALYRLGTSVESMNDKRRNEVTKDVVNAYAKEAASNMMNQKRCEELAKQIASKQEKEEKESDDHLIVGVERFSEGQPQHGKNVEDTLK